MPIVNLIFLDKMPLWHDVLSDSASHLSIAQLDDFNGPWCKKGITILLIKYSVKVKYNNGVALNFAKLHSHLGITNFSVVRKNKITLQYNYVEFKTKQPKLID